MGWIDRLLGRYEPVPTWRTTPERDALVRNLLELQERLAEQEGIIPPGTAERNAIAREREAAERWGGRSGE